MPIHRLPPPGAPDVPPSPDHPVWLVYYVKLPRARWMRRVSKYDGIVGVVGVDNAQAARAEAAPEIARRMKAARAMMKRLGRTYHFAPTHFRVVKVSMQTAPSPKSFRYKYRRADGTFVPPRRRDGIWMR